MNPFAPSWVELSVVVPLVGAVCVGRLRNPDVAYRWCQGFTGAALVCAVFASVSFAYGLPPGWGYLPRESAPLLAVSELNVALLPVVALLHFLTALATVRTKLSRFSFAWMLFGEALRLGMLASVEPWLLIGLSVVATTPPFFELRGRGRPTRVFLLHMSVFVSLLVAGWTCVVHLPEMRSLAGALLLAAVLVRSGTVPFHLWVADLCENGTFGNALLYITPLNGAYLAVRLVLPVAPDWALTGLGLVSLITAFYAAGMATIQTNARRLYAYLFLSHASLILVGMELHTSVSLTGSLSLWLSVMLSLGGLGLTLRALEARVGPLSLTRYHGLYEHSPALAVCFVLTGLASVGFPGTMGCVAAELLVDGVVAASPLVGIVAIATSALNGIAVLRAYLLLFTGSRHTSTVSLAITNRERFAVLTLAAIILLGGLIPQLSVEMCNRAAEAVLRTRGAAGEP